MSTVYSMDFPGLLQARKLPRENNGLRGSIITATYSEVHLNFARRIKKIPAFFGPFRMAQKIPTRPNRIRYLRLDIPGRQVPAFSISARLPGGAR